MVLAARRVYWRFLNLLLVSCLGAFAVTLQPAEVGAASCSRNVLVVAAHQDDDLFFMSPDILTDVANGTCLTVVYVTAGDAGEPEAYWQEREKGPQAAYSTMLGVPADQPWTTTTSEYAGHSVATAISPGAGAVTLLFLRLPDGGLSGQGFSRYGSTSLSKLWSGAIGSIGTVDGSSTYSKSDLTATMSAIVHAADPSIVRTQDARDDQGDHPDHSAVGRLANAALDGYAGEVVSYRGYNTAQEPANVAGDQLVAKTAALQAYAAHDPFLCANPTPCPDGVYADWAARQYNAPSPSAVPSVPPVAGPAPYGGPNVARDALVAGSSQAPGQALTAAVDAVVGGWPGSPGAEWSSNGERAGAFVELSWGSVQTVDRVFLFDRPNGVDQVTGGVLTFSDGSSVLVPALANDGSVTVVEFAARSVTSLRFTVSSVSGSTENVGLAEIEVYNGDPASAGGTSAPNGD